MTYSFSLWSWLLTMWNYKGKGHRGPWEAKIQTDTKERGKATGKDFRFVYTFSKNSLSWTSQLSEWGSFSPSCQRSPSCTALPTAPLMHSPRGNPKRRSTSLKNLTNGRRPNHSNGSVHVWLEINCQRHRGIPFVSKVLLQRNSHPHLSLRKTLCGRLCGLSYNAMTEKPVFNWSLLKMHSPDKTQRHKEQIKK